MSDHQKWLAPLTASGRHADALAELPDGIAAMTAAIQGLLVHADWAEAYGLEATSSRHTLSVADRLDDIVRRNPATLGIARPPAQRSTGSCRDFALLLCAALRQNGVPARIRCGFAAYFDPPWEDHWLCQYWHAASRSWRLADAQIDAMLRDRQAIAFDATDVPHTQFRMAGEAWLACRGGEDNALRFGHGAVTGLWFIGINVVRDHLVLNGRITSGWDRWREAPEPLQRVSEQDFARLDRLAREPEQGLIDGPPQWLA